MATKIQTQKKKASTNMLYGLAGEYAVCAELCRRGLLALPTPKNNPTFDIAAVEPKTLKTVAIQVKTMSPENTQGWNLGGFKALDFAPANLYVILVNMSLDDPTEFYIYEYPTFVTRVTEIYEEYIRKPKKDGTPRKSTTMRWIDFRDMKETDRQKRNNWELLRFS